MLVFNRLDSSGFVKTAFYAGQYSYGYAVPKKLGLRQYYRQNLHRRQSSCFFLFGHFVGQYSYGYHLPKKGIVLTSVKREREREREREKFSCFMPIRLNKSKTNLKKTNKSKVQEDSIALTERREEESQSRNLSKFKNQKNSPLIDGYTTSFIVIIIIVDH